MDYKNLGQFFLAHSRQLAVRSLIICDYNTTVQSNVMENYECVLILFSGALTA